MPAFNKFNDFVEQCLRGNHNFGSDTFKVALSNTAPAATNAQLSDITQISAGNGYAAGGPTIANVTLAETSGTAKVTMDDPVITASGGSIGPFQYFVIYNDTATNDLLVGWYTRTEGAVTLSDGETITLDFDGTNGVFTLA